MGGASISTFDHELRVDRRQQTLQRMVQLLGRDQRIFRHKGVQPLHAVTEISQAVLQEKMSRRRTESMINM